MLKNVVKKMIVRDGFSQRCVYLAVCTLRCQSRTYISTSVSWKGDICWTVLRILSAYCTAVSFQYSLCKTITATLKLCTQPWYVLLVLYLLYT